MPFGCQVIWDLMDTLRYRVGATLAVTNAFRLSGDLGHIYDESMSLSPFRFPVTNAFRLSGDLGLYPFFALISSGFYEGFSLTGKNERPDRVFLSKNGGLNFTKQSS